jgi:hypothetical protein
MRWRSVRQIPQARTSTSTSPPAGAGTGCCLSCKRPARMGPGAANVHAAMISDTAPPNHGRPCGGRDQSPPRAGLYALPSPTSVGDHGYMIQKPKDRPCITVAVTSSAAAVAALRWALQRAADDGSSIVAVHVFDESDRADLAVDRDPQQAALDASKLAKDRTLAELAELNVPVPVRIVTERGPVRLKLAELAARADLLVLGLPQDATHRDLPRALSGLCQCPVVTVSADGVAVVHEGSTLASVW